MKRLGSLTIVACAAAAAFSATAGAATAPLQIPGTTGEVPAAIGFPLDAAWAHPVYPGTPPPGAADLRWQTSTPLSDGASCVQGAFVVGVAVTPAARPVLVGDTLRLHPAGSLLPRMKVERHGTAGAVRWYAGAAHDTTVAPGVSPPLQQGIAVLPAPKWATRAGRSVIVVRVVLDLNVQRVGADGFPTGRPTAAEASECFPPLRDQLGPRLRSILRAVSVQRRA
jgi:hypothetical protein